MYLRFDIWKTSIFRLRPSNCFTIDELTKSYLWFSKPIYYKDVNDSNVASFLDENENMKNAFKRIFGDNNNIAEKALENGICCFTKSLPKTELWAKFPNSHNGICIEYDKRELENYFLKKGFGNCFKQVEYSKTPLIFESSDKNRYDILWEENNGDEKIYKSINEIVKDDKNREKLFEKMFTSLNSRYSHQNELRIIIGKHRMEPNYENEKGYKYPIERSAIKGIHLHPCTPEWFVKELKNSVDDKLIVEKSI